MVYSSNRLAEFEDDGYRQPAEWMTWSYVERETWAFEGYDATTGQRLSHREQRWRKALFATYDATVDPSEVPASDRGGSSVTFGSGSAASWDDHPLDNILDQIDAGTLTLPVPTVGQVDDGGGGLFYAGRVNGLAGESGGGKGWVALATAAEHLAAGQHVYYLDYEDTAALALQRLVSVLRVPSDLVRGQFHYVHPEGHDRAGIEAMIERVRSTPDALVIVDSTGESIAASGKNQNADEEVAAWFQQLPHPLADAGACVILLDHMTKSDDGGLWPIGSQRKRAAITGAQYVLNVIEPFSKSANGYVTITVAKDRGGHREARSVAAFVQFTHPIERVDTADDGTLTPVMSEELNVRFTRGKSATEIQADKEARAAAALEADIATLDGLDPAPKSVRDVKDRMAWGDTRAQTALREWRTRRT